MAPSLLPVAFAVASGGALALGFVQDDAAALLQTHAATSTDGSELRHGGKGTRGCRCLKWKEAYADYGVKCGRHEFRWVGKAKDREGENHNAGLKAEMCQHFFEQFGENYCVQRFFNKRAKTQWCYVSAECEELNGGAPVENSAASWKICNSTNDRLLYNQSPERLYQISQFTHMDPAYMLKMAYPVWGHSEKMLRWPGVQAALGIAKPRNGNLTEKVYGLKVVQATNEPWILDSLDTRVPYGLVYGDKIMEVKYTDWFWTQSDNFAEVYNDKQHWATNYTCLAGCK